MRTTIIKHTHTLTLIST